MDSDDEFSSKRMDGKSAHSGQTKTEERRMTDPVTGTTGEKSAVGGPHVKSRGGQANIPPGTLLEEMEQKEEQTAPNPEDAAVVHVYINKRKADLSNEEITFFRAATAGKHVSQTHFADPAAEFR